MWVFQAITLAQIVSYNQLTLVDSHAGSFSPSLIGAGYGLSSRHRVCSRENNDNKRGIGGKRSSKFFYYSLFAIIYSWQCMRTESVSGDFLLTRFIPWECLGLKAIEQCRWSWPKAWQGKATLWVTLVMYIMDSNHSFIVYNFKSFNIVCSSLFSED